MFVISKSTRTAVNLSHIESINVSQLGEGNFDVQAWTTRETWYSLGTFKTLEEANQYIEMICKEYNLLWRGR